MSSWTWQKLSRVGHPGWEDRASGSPTWGQCGQELNGENVAPTPEPYHLVSAGVPNSICPGGVQHQFRLGAASRPHCGSKLSRVGALELGETDQDRLSLGWCWLSLWEGLDFYTSP